MNNFIEVGKIVNSFGIKGEVKIVSDFEHKTKMFKDGYPIYIGREKQKEIVNTYRIHKNFDLVTFKGYSNINEILKYKGKCIYTLRSDLKLKDNEYLLSDLIGYEVYDDDKLIGVVISYEKERNNTLLKIKGEKSFYIPLIPIYINDVLVKDKKIITNKGSDLII